MRLKVSTTHLDLIFSTIVDNVRENFIQLCFLYDSDVEKVSQKLCRKFVNMGNVKGYLVAKSIQDYGVPYPHFVDLLNQNKLPLTKKILSDI